MNRSFRASTRQIGVLAFPDLRTRWVAALLSILCLTLNPAWIDLAHAEQDNEEDDDADETRIELILSFDSLSTGSRDPAASSAETRADKISAEFGISRSFLWTDRFQAYIDFIAETQRTELTPDIGSGTDSETSTEFAGVDELWLGWKPVTNKAATLWFGRRLLKDNTGWWWDDELAGAGMMLERDNLGFSLAVTQLREPWSTRDTVEDPENESVVFALASITARLSDSWSGSTYLTRQIDRSPAYLNDQEITEPNFDEIDANITWLGSRYQYHSPQTVAGIFSWLVDAAYMTGSQQRFLLEDVEESEEEPGEDTEDAAEEEVEETTGGVETETIAGDVRESLRGWAINTWLGWEPTFVSDTRLQLGYAIGSGTSRNQSPGSGTYRQTGLQSNESDTVYYGTIADPELANLRIATLLIAHGIAEDRTLYFQHNQYWRTSRHDDTFEFDIDLEPDNANLALGYETAMSIDVDFGNNLSASATVSRFKPGSAFATADRAAIDYYELELTYEF